MRFVKLFKLPFFSLFATAIAVDDDDDDDMVVDGNFAQN